MEWAAIIVAILKIVADCRSEADEATIVARIRDGGPLVQLAIGRALKQAGYTGRQLRKRRRQINNDRRSMSDAEILAFIREDPEEAQSLARAMAG